MSYLNRNCFWTRSLNLSVQVTYYIICVKCTQKRYLIVPPSVSGGLCFPKSFCGTLNEVITFVFLLFSSGASWHMGGSQKYHLKIRANNRIPLYLHGARPTSVPPEPHQTSHRCRVGSGSPGWRTDTGRSHLLLSAVRVFFP